MKIQTAVLLAGCFIFAGCHSTTRSISNSSYRESDTACDRPYWTAAHSSDPAFQYRGELSEFDVLGVSRDQIATESEISRALDDAKGVKLRRASSILLIQSGAVFPDSAMASQLEKHFRVSPFSGIPPMRHNSEAYDDENLGAESYSRSLRLAAARGGNDVILCYWGILESETENLATKTVSWIPVANWFAPDEKQHLRIRLRLALVDVRSGDWTVFSPRVFDTASLTVSPRRGASDQKQVERLKAEAHASAVKELARLYSELVSAN